MIMIRLKISAKFRVMVKVKDRVRVIVVFRVRVRFFLSIQWRQTGRHLFTKFSQYNLIHLCVVHLLSAYLEII